MAWTVEYTDTSKAQIRKLDRHTARHILDYIDERVAVLEDPRQRGRALRSNLGGLWRYRVGDYRVICDIQDDALRVLVVRVGGRGQVYR